MNTSTTDRWRVRRAVHRDLLAISRALPHLDDDDLDRLAERVARLRAAIEARAKP